MHVPLLIFLMIGLTTLSLECHSSPTDTQKVRSKNWNGFGHQRNWHCDLDLSGEAKLSMKWQKTVGEGYSQIVGNPNRIFVASGSRLPGSDAKKIETRITAYETKSGKQLWQYVYESELYGNHQTMGGKQPSPQSTPLLMKDRLVFCTFNGDLICLRQNDGGEVWQKSLKDEFQAEAVQFGSASSPTRCVGDEQAFVVLAAGSGGGILKLNLMDGSLIWRCPVKTFGYATPVYAEFCNQPQWIVVSRNHVISADANSGRELWRYALNEKGLTNVPTPLIVDDSRIVVSCQSSKGTECISVKTDGDQLRAEQEWFNPRMQYFYTNWLNLDESLVVACNDNSLNVFNKVDGKRVGRWRGFGDGNILIAKNHLLVLGGNGKLGVIAVDDQSKSLVVKQEYQIDNGRFWVAPSVIENDIFIRSADKLYCIHIGKQTTQKSLVNQIEPGKQRRLSMNIAQSNVDPVDEIFRIFENDGQDAAIAFYNELRKQNKLNEVQRITLASAAHQQGMNDIAVKILQDASDDFPDSKLILETLEKLSKGK